MVSSCGIGSREQKKGAKQSDDRFAPFFAFILRGSEGPLGSNCGTDVEGLREEGIVLHPQLGTNGEIEFVRHADKLVYIAPHLRLGAEDHPTAILIGTEVGPEHGKAADGPDAIPAGPGGIAPRAGSCAASRSQSHTGSWAPR